MTVAFRCVIVTPQETDRRVASTQIYSPRALVEHCAFAFRFMILWCHLLLTSLGEKDPRPYVALV